MAKNITNGTAGGSAVSNAPTIAAVYVPVYGPGGQAPAGGAVVIIAPK